MLNQAKNLNNLDKCHTINLAPISSCIFYAKVLSWHLISCYDPIGQKPWHQLNSSHKKCTYVYFYNHHDQIRIARRYLQLQKPTVDPIARVPFLMPLASHLELFLQQLSFCNHYERQEWLACTQVVWTTNPVWRKLKHISIARNFNRQTMIKNQNKLYQRVVA